MSILLRIKDWKLFLLIFGVPLLFQAAFIWSIITTIPSGPTPASFIYSYILFGILIIVLFSIIFFGWLWGIGVGLQKHLPEELRLPTGQFRFSVLIPTLYLLTMGLIAASMMGPDRQNIVLGNAGILILLVIFHVIAVFSIFYSIYFAAKTLKTIELEHPVHFPDFAGEFFLIWFYPIGIWVIQPRLNDIVEKK